MPNGIIHEKYRGAYTLPVSISAFFGAVVISIVMKNLYPFIPALVVIIQYRLTKYIDPDLDQVGRTKSETRMLDNFGPITGKLFQVYWTIYAGFMNTLATFFGIAHPWYGAHRTWLTHSIFPGTVIRMIWFDLPFVVIWYLFFDLPVVLVPVIISVLVAQFGALAIADYIHIWLDNNYKERTYGPKRTTSRERKRRRISRSRRER